MELHVTPFGPDILWYEVITGVNILLIRNLFGYINDRERIRTTRR